ncbi:hypothetical protein [Halorubellus sp. PRR65]|uniref:hypothetical protein n=1 Tax=Halorubellus sp. PRR65 TaxID=3098148 RepID=UPI002B263C13|nr:hypothetical protein [Halorubellus sp. PRR65]
MSRLGDGALAAGVLAVVVALAAAGGVRASPFAFAAGAVGAVLLEGLLSARATVVEAVWARRTVRVVSVAVTVLAAAAAAAFRPKSGLSALAGGLVAYLLVLALVAGGLVPPSTAWFGTDHRAAPRSNEE